MQRLEVSILSISYCYNTNKQKPKGECTALEKIKYWLSKGS